MYTNLDFINKKNLKYIDYIHYEDQNGSLNSIFDITGGYIKGEYLILESKNEAVMHIHALNLYCITITKASPYSNK